MIIPDNCEIYTRVTFIILVFESESVYCDQGTTWPLSVYSRRKGCYQRKLQHNMYYSVLSKSRTVTFSSIYDIYIYTLKFCQKRFTANRHFEATFYITFSASSEVSDVYPKYQPMTFFRFSRELCDLTACCSQIRSSGNVFVIFYFRNVGRS